MMGGVFFAGADLDDDSRTEAVARLGADIRIVVVPVTDSRPLPNPWLRFPKAIAWMVADFFEWNAVVSSRDLPRQSRRDDILTSAVANAFGRGEVLVLDARAASNSVRLPSLTPTDAPTPAWLRDAVATIAETLGPVRSQVDLIALQAGVLQMTDDLSASHEHSQSIEGRGTHRAGDYWHAINHRREPDDGNAKYWFRRVGSHPLLTELANAVPELSQEFSPPVQVQADQLIESGKLDPFRFVDLVSEACRRKDQDLIRFAERLQWMEMVGLMEWTLRDATS